MATMSNPMASFVDWRTIGFQEISAGAGWDGKPESIKEKEKKASLSDWKPEEDPMYLTAIRNGILLVAKSTDGGNYALVRIFDGKSEIYNASREKNPDLKDIPYAMSLVSELKRVQSRWKGVDPEMRERLIDIALAPHGRNIGKLLDKAWERIVTYKGAERDRLEIEFDSAATAHNTSKVDRYLGFK
jgi:hypothetical protein